MEVIEATQLTPRHIAGSGSLELIIAVRGLKHVQNPPSPRDSLSCVSVNEAGNGCRLSCVGAGHLPLRAEGELPLAGTVVLHAALCCPLDKV